MKKKLKNSYNDFRGKLQEIFELSITLRKLDVATYFKKISGITFQRMLLFELSQNVPTDRLIVSNEGVRVMDIRQ